mgnify:CR=1 FL=1
MPFHSSKASCWQDRSSCLAPYPAYSGSKSELNLFFNIQKTDSIGNELPFSGRINLYLDEFKDYPQHYITGFVLTNNGLYSGKEPALSFNKYYYVEGIPQNFQNLLFLSIFRHQFNSRP